MEGMSVAFTPMPAFARNAGNETPAAYPTMLLLAALLAGNAVLHGVVIARFGLRNHNQPFAVFAAVDAALAVLILLSVPYAIWAVLVLSLVGLVGLTVTFNKPARAKTLDKAIWALDALTVLSAAYLLFGTRL